MHRPGGGRHLVSDTGLAIVCRDLGQLFLAEKGENESAKNQPPGTVQLESPECIADFPTRAGADLEGTVQCSGFFMKGLQ